MPKKEARNISRKEIEEASKLHSEIDTEQFLENVRERDDCVVVAIDIDNTAAFGNDTNQILSMVTKISNDLNEDLNTNIMSDVYDVAKLLINPKMLKAIDDIRHNRKIPYIMFYTQKEKIVSLFCEDESVRECLYENGFFSHGQLHTLKFKPGSIIQSWHYLYDQVYEKCEEIREILDSEPKYKDYLTRLAIITWAASVALKMPYSAPVFITSGVKTMQILARELGFPFTRDGVYDVSKIYLFDDLANRHAIYYNSAFIQGEITEADTMEKCKKEHMILVDPYNLRTMQRDTARALFDALNKNFPITDEFIERNQTLYNSVSSAGYGHTEEDLIIDRRNNNWAFKIDLTSTVELHDSDVSFFTNPSPVHRRR